MICLRRTCRSLPGERRGAINWDGVSVPRGFWRTARRGFLGVLTGLLMRIRRLLLNNLGTSLFGGELLAVLAVLVPSASQMPVMAFFPGFLSGFFAYLCTWYCFPVLFSLENKMQTIPLEAFYSGLGLHIDTVPALQVVKNRSLWARTLTK